MCLGPNKELFSLERDFDKESSFGGDIGRGDCGLEGGNPESELRGLLDEEMEQEMVEMEEMEEVEEMEENFDSESRG
jgi:hypothetical protein